MENKQAAALEISPEKKAEMILSELSQSAIARSLRNSQFDEASKTMARTIRDVVVGNEPPISQLAKVVSMERITAQLEFELIKANDLVSVGSKLNTQQVQFVAEAILEAFPHETLADFKIACQRGCIGQYGEIFRLDGIVIRGWIEKYLEEKYLEVEKQARKFKESETKKTPPAVMQQMPEKHLKEMQRIVDETPKRMKMPAMSDADVRRWGQKDPAKKTALTAGWATYELGGYKVEAMDRKHAKKIMRIFIRNGDVPFHMSRGKT